MTTAAAAAGRSLSIRRAPSAALYLRREPGGGWAVCVANATGLAGVQFDPDLVEPFMRVLDRYVPALAAGEVVTAEELCMTAPARMPRSAQVCGLLVDRRMIARNVRDVLSWRLVLTRSRPTEKRPMPAASIARTAFMRTHRMGQIRGAVN